MSDIRYRIQVRPIDGESFILEHYESSADAEAYFKELQTDTENNPIYSVPYKTLVIQFDEFYKGSWIQVTKKIITR